MSNKNLVLPNYYVQSSDNYIINLTENIYTASIARRLRMCLVCRSSGVQNLTPVKSCTVSVQHYKRFVTASTSTLVSQSTLPWRYDAEMNTANSLHVAA